MDGNWKDGDLNGLGMQVFLNLRSMEEQKAAEEAAVKNKEHLPELERYEGQFKHGRKHGQGYYCFPNGDRYSGAWSEGGQHG